MLKRVRLDAAAIQSLRSMLVAEMGSVVQRMADPLVVEEPLDPAGNPVVEPAAEVEKKKPGRPKKA